MEGLSSGAAPSWTAEYPDVEKLLQVDLQDTLHLPAPVLCVQFSPDGTHVAMGCDRYVRLVQLGNTRRYREISLLDSNSDAPFEVRTICFSPNGSSMAIGAPDERIRIWNIRGQNVSFADQHAREVYSLDVSCDGLVVTPGPGPHRQILIWDMVSMETKWEARTHPNDSAPSAGPGATSVAFSPNGRLVAAGCPDCVIRIWDVELCTLLAELEGHTGRVNSIVFTPDGEGLVSGSLDATSKYWELGPLLANPDTPVDVQHIWTGSHELAREEETMTIPCAKDLDDHEHSVASVTISPGGRWVVTSCEDRVQFYDMQTFSLQCEILAHNDPVTSVHFSPAGGLLATGGMDKEVMIWKYEPLGSSVFYVSRRSHLGSGIGST